MLSSRTEEQGKTLRTRRLPEGGKGPEGDGSLRRSLDVRFLPIYPPAMPSQVRVVGYARASSEGQGESGLGLEAQRQVILTECQRRGWDCLRIEEDILSGRDAHNRPGLQAALGACRSGEASGLVVAKLDRLSRSVIDSASIFKDAQRRGYNLVAIDLGIDLGTSNGKMIATVMSALGEWERELISERTKAALAEKRRKGEKLGAPSRIGPETRARILSLREEGASERAIARTLNQEGISPPAGREWRHTSLRSVR